MTVSEACTLLVDVTRQLSAMRADRDAWRFVATQAIHYAADLTRENEMIDRRRYVHRRYMDQQREDPRAA